MNNKLKNLLAPDFRNTFLNSLWSIVKGPITALLIPLFLSENAQGYWYTFGSLAALSTLADLGFTTIVGQFAAHEYAHLKLVNGCFEGDHDHLLRLASLFRYVFNWACLVALIAFPVIFGVGVVTLNTADVGVDWIIPWIMYVFVTGINFIVNVFLSFFEGCGQLEKIQINRLFGSIVSTAVTWSILAINMELYALALGSLAGLITNIILLMLRYNKSLLQLFRIKRDKLHKWSKDFLGLLWKYALSWISGYLVFQIYTPLAFLYFDPISAGKVGITMSLCQACFVLASVWLTVSTPKLNMCAARKDWSRMDSLIKRNLFLSISTMLLGMGIAAVLLLILKGKLAIIDRLMDFSAIMMLLSTWLLQIFINAFAIYGRAHKREPFMIPSLISSALTVVGTFLAIYYLPINYMFLGFGIIAFFFVFVFAFIFFKYRDKWHNDLSLQIDYEEKIAKNNEQAILTQNLILETNSNAEDKGDMQ